MALIDTEEFKRVMSGMKTAIPPNPHLSPRPPPPRNRAAAKQMIQAVLAKAGLDMSELDRMAKEDHDELRRFYQLQTAEQLKLLPSALAAYHQGLKMKVSAVAPDDMLAPMYLDQTFLIWEQPFPGAGLLVDAHGAPLDNWAKIYLNTFYGQAGTEIVFNFVWQNPSDEHLVIDVESSFSLNGVCSLNAAPGIYSGDKTEFSISSYIGILRWSGWGLDPITGMPADQTYYYPNPVVDHNYFAEIFDHQLQGGHIFDAGDYYKVSFITYPSPPIQRTFVAVPGRAVTVFTATIQIGYTSGPDPDNNVSDEVMLDFSNGNHLIMCPYVLLTPRYITANHS